MLAERIRYQRNKKDISQSELGKICGVVQQTVGSWETGRTTPDPETIRTLADFFGVSTDYLLGKTAVEDNTAHTSHGLPTNKNTFLKEHGSVYAPNCEITLDDFSKQYPDIAKLLSEDNMKKIDLLEENGISLDTLRTLITLARQIKHG